MVSGDRCGCGANTNRSQRIVADILFAETIPQTDRYRYVAKIFLKNHFFVHFFAGGPAEALLNNAEYPLMFIFSIAAIAVLLLLVNICILTAFFYKRKKFQGSMDELYFLIERTQIYLYICTSVFFNMSKSI